MATRLLFCQSMRMILQSTLKDLLPEGGHRTASERMFRRVVVAAELSPAHERLLADMTELAARTGGKVTGVLAARPRSMDDALTHPWLERTRATQASAFVRPYWAGPDATSFDALIAYERENGADLVGVAAAPTSVWRRSFVDPDVRTACAVSSSPVWVAGRYPAFTTSSAPAPSIVAAVNLMSGSEAIVRFADMLATAISARLLIAYVLPEVTEASLTDSLTKPDTVLAQVRCMRAIERTCKHLRLATRNTGPSRRRRPADQATCSGRSPGRDDRRQERSNRPQPNRDTPHPPSPLSGGDRSTCLISSVLGPLRVLCGRTAQAQLRILLPFRTERRYRRKHGIRRHHRLSSYARRQGQQGRASQHAS